MVSFLITVIEYLTRAIQERKEGFTLTHNSRVQFVIAGMSGPGA